MTGRLILACRPYKTRFRPVGSHYPDAESTVKRKSRQRQFDYSECACHYEVAKLRGGKPPCSRRVSQSRMTASMRVGTSIGLTK